MNPLGILRALPPPVWTGVLAASSGLLGFGYVFKSCEADRLREERVEERRRADSLAAEAAAERARADGWEVAFAENVDDLHGRLAEGDSMIARLGRDLRASRVRVDQLTELTAELRGSGESEARPDSIAADSVPASWSGTYDDDLLRARWTFRRLPPPATLLLREWAASFGVELVQATTGDGRTLITARTSDPDRVKARVDSLFVDPPPPEVREVGVSWWWIPASIAGGYLAGEAGIVEDIADLMPF